MTARSNRTGREGDEVDRLERAITMTVGALLLDMGEKRRAKVVAKGLANACFLEQRLKVTYMKATDGGSVVRIRQPPPDDVERLEANLDALEALIRVLRRSA